IELDRKVLAAIAFDDAETFAGIVSQVKAVLEAAPAAAA
ncbi:MAG TPA: 50S ribosomal protein L20, partial [Acidisoma sp.]|nr:50S ribosomal protein L20 [Acidisoma sp.]